MNNPIRSITHTYFTAQGMEAVQALVNRARSHQRDFLSRKGNPLLKDLALSAMIRRDSYLHAAQCARIYLASRNR